MIELPLIVERLTTQAPAVSVLATLVAVAGSSYRRQGARMLLAGETRWGAISGGCLEEDITARALHVRQSGRAEVAVYDTTSENDLVWGVGLGCHGVVHVLIEPLHGCPEWATELQRSFAADQSARLDIYWDESQPHAMGTRLGTSLEPLPTCRGVFRETITPPTRLLVVGAGDDAQPLVRMAKALGWHVTVADARVKFATRERFPEANRVTVINPAKDLANQGIDLPRHLLVVIMTHHYMHDLPVLKQLLPLPLRYLGLLGPKQRAQRLLADLSTGGLTFTPEQVARLHAPVGLDLGANNAAEVALSIIAEIQATLSAREGRPLRERTRPIHD